MYKNKKLVLLVLFLTIVIILISVYFFQRDTPDLTSYNITFSNPDDLDTDKYTLNAYDAIRIAIKQVKDDQIVFIEVFPIEEITFKNNTLRGEFWVVHIYHDPLELPHGSFTVITIDQKGTVIDIHRVEWVIGG
jgi:hypothetical protein